MTLTDITAIAEYFDVEKALDDITHQSAMEADVTNTEFSEKVIVKTASTLVTVTKNLQNLINRWIHQNQNEINTYINRVFHLNDSEIRAKSAELKRQTIELKKLQVQLKTLQRGRAGSDLYEQINANYIAVRDSVEMLKDSLISMKRNVLIPRVLIDRVVQKSDDIMANSISTINTNKSSYDSIVSGLTDASNKRFPLSIDDALDEMNQVMGTFRDPKLDVVSHITRNSDAVYQATKALKGFNPSKNEVWIEAPMQTLMHINQAYIDIRQMKTPLLVRLRDLEKQSHTIVKAKDIKDAKKVMLVEAECSTISGILTCYSSVFTSYMECQLTLLEWISRHSKN